MLNLCTHNFSTYLFLLYIDCIQLNSFKNLEYLFHYKINFYFTIDYIIYVHQIYLQKVNISSGNAKIE